MANPVLIEVTRGRLVECSHRAAVAVVRGEDEILLAIGDCERPVFPRSAIKSLQALALVESGACERFSFDDKALALACASHAGQPGHVEIARRMLDQTGLDEGALACGAHWPSRAEAARDLARTADRPSRLHNNCSGKHAGMLATAVHLGEPVDGYTDPAHPVQVRIRGALEELTGAALMPEYCGMDGCSAPNWAMGLETMARAFARVASASGAGERFAGAYRRIMSACWAEPFLVGGTDRLDTVLLGLLRHRAITKTGAEGVYCAAVPELGIGIALKVDDGAKRASQALIVHVLAALFGDADRDAFEELKSQRLYNWDAIMVGEVRPADELVLALRQI